MERNRIRDCQSEREQRAALRANILQYGRMLGWPAHTAITFTERLARRPWKRCTGDQLATALDDLQAIHQAFAERRRVGQARAEATIACAADQGGGLVDRSS